MQFVALHFTFSKAFKSIAILQKYDTQAETKTTKPLAIGLLKKMSDALGVSNTLCGRL